MVPRAGRLNSWIQVLQRVKFLILPPDVSKVPLKINVWHGAGPGLGWQGKKAEVLCAQSYRLVSACPRPPQGWPAALEAPPPCLLVLCLSMGTCWCRRPWRLALSRNTAEGVCDVWPLPRLQVHPSQLPCLQSAWSTLGDLVVMCCRPHQVRARAHPARGGRGGRKGHRAGRRGIVVFLFCHFAVEIVSGSGLLFLARGTFPHTWFRLL
jgi:hypothetical protein